MVLGFLALLGAIALWLIVSIFFGDYIGKATNKLIIKIKELFN